MWRTIPLMVAVFVAACTSDNPDRCNNPPTVASADVKNEYGIQQDFTVGRYVHYECLPGYTWNNSTPNFVVCQANFTWSEPLISCMPKDCGEPKDMPNGYYTTTGKTYGKVTTYHCNKGYRQFGKSNVLCTVRGWDKITLFCQIITCAPPSSISNGNVTQRDRWIYGADAKYSCRASYTLIGRHTINCTVSGNWSHKAPACQVITCAPPSSISNGNVTQRESWIYGTDAKYSCHAGYTLIGQRTINCTDTGNWSHEAPTCQVITCAPLSSISNGNVTQRDRWIYGTDAEYSCHVGYTLIGQRTINCTVSGNWSHEAPTCQVITCAPPSSISNGNVTQRDRWIYGTDAKYSCRAGYTLIGRHTINCTVSGNWSHEAPTCQALPDHKEQFSTPSIISATRARETTPQNNYITMDSGDMNHLLSSLPSHTTPYEQKQTDISIATTANTINKTIPPNNSPIPTNSSNKSLMLSAVPNYSSNGYWKKWICFGIAAIIVSTVLLIIKVICDRRKYGSYKTGSQFPEYHKETERATINFIGNRNCSLL